MAWDDSRSRMGACRLLSRCRTDVFDDCAVPCLFVDIVKLPLKPPPLCVACSDMQTMKRAASSGRSVLAACETCLLRGQMSIGTCRC